MDTEHYKLQNFSSIGLAFISNLEPSKRPTHPKAMTFASEKGKSLDSQQTEESSSKVPMARSICFNIQGFERAHPTRERIWGEPDHDIDVEDISSKVTDFVQECKEEAPETPCILVTYSAQAELNAIASLFPQLCLFFSSWVDLQPLVLEAYHRNSDFARLDGVIMSLRNAMRILRFRGGYQPSHHHHAGNDALRTLAIMKCVTHEKVKCRRSKRMEHMLWLQQQQIKQHRLKGTAEDRGLKGRRPGPSSQYPHIVKITLLPSLDSGGEHLVGHQFPVPDEEQDNDGLLHLPPIDVDRPDKVWAFFSPYEPTALARVCKENCYYVCVSNRAILEQLLCDLDKALVCQGTHILMVEDVHALGAATREERAKRKQAEEEGDWLDWAQS